MNIILPVAAGLALCLTACSAGEARSKPEPQAGSERSTKARASTAAGAAATSRILGTRDIKLRGKPACDIRYVYGGHAPDNLFWEEPCRSVTARLLTRAELQALGRWERLDAFQQRFVEALPGGRVLYVEGSFSASVYPIGTTGTAFEVPVTD